MKILSWNVNGLRAVYKKGFWEWLEKLQSESQRYRTALEIADEALNNPFEPTTMPHKSQVEYETYCENLQEKAKKLVKEALLPREGNS